MFTLYVTATDASRDERLTMLVDGQLGYIVACAMGFTSIHYGYAAEGNDAYSLHYDSKKAQSVS